jgi:replicative DNA helicase
VEADFVKLDLDDLEIFERLTSRPLARATLSGDVADSITRYESLMEGKRTGMMTPFTRLNELSGGLKPGNFVVVAAPSGGFKTSFALNIARHVAMTEQVAFFSLEMSRQEVLDLLFSMTLSIDRNHFNTGKFTPGEMDKLSFKRGEVGRLKMSIFDDAFVGVDEVRADCLSLSCDEPLGLIVVDYLQLMSIHGFKSNREQEIAQISHGLKAIASENKCPVIALSQLNEEGYLRESRAIGHDANVILLLASGPYGITVKIDKGRMIPRGAFELSVIEEFCRIENA